MARLTDVGWGDWRLTDTPSTRVTQAQAEALARFGKCEAGASEVRFGDMTGELLVVLPDGRWVELGEDGSYEDVTEEVVG